MLTLASSSSSSTTTIIIIVIVVVIIIIIIIISIFVVYGLNLEGSDAIIGNFGWFGFALVLLYIFSV